MSGPAGEPACATESFRTTSGVTLRLTRWTAGRARERAVLLLPGILMHRECVEMRLLARRLAADAGADVVTLDVRGHGDSEGFFTWGRREAEDVAEVASALRRDYARLGGLGFSFGGYHTAVAAALHRPFDAVALVAAPHRLFVLDHNPLGSGLARSVPYMLKRQRRFPRLSIMALPRRDNPGRLIHRIAPVPLLIVHGTADWLVSVHHAQLLFARAGEPKRLVLVERGLHAESMLVDDPEPLVQPLARFFAETLGADEPPVTTTGA